MPANQLVHLLIDLNIFKLLLLLLFYFLKLPFKIKFPPAPINSNFANFNPCGPNLLIKTVSGDKTTGSP